MKNILTLVLLVFSLDVYSGNERGNGGDVVVCKNAQGQTVSSEILDVYEAKEIRQIVLQLGSASLEVAEKLKLLTERLSLVSPEFAKFITTEYALFWKEAKFLDNIILNDIPDSDHLYIPKGCAIEQIAIQRKPEFEEDKRFVISNDLWRNLSNDNKLALIIHEIIFKLAIENGHTDSRKVRYFNSLVLSENILNYKGIKFPEMISKLAIHHEKLTYLYKGYEFKVSDYNIGSSDIGGEIVSPATIDIHKNPLVVYKINFFREGFGVGYSSIELDPHIFQKFELKNDDGQSIISGNVCQYMNFRTDGSLKHIFGCQPNIGFESYAFVAGQKIQFTGHLALSEAGDGVDYIHALTPYIYEYFDNKIPFYGNLIFSNGVLVNEELYISKNIIMNVLGVKFEMRKDSKVRMNELGQLNFVEFEDHSSWVKLPPQRNTFYCFRPISFNDNGSLKSCTIQLAGSGMLLIDRDGNEVRVNGGDTVWFDQSGYLYQ